MSFIAPDWRDASQYPAPDTETNLVFWAWQFLRRNHDYQTDWSNYISDLQRVVECEPKWLAYLQRKNCLAEVFRGQEAPTHSEEWKFAFLAAEHMPIEFVDVDPEPWPDERTVGEWSARLRTVQRGRGGVRPREIALGEKWGLNFIQNPGLEKLQRSNGFLNDGRRVRLIGDTNERIDDENFWIPEIDLRYPVEVLRAQFEIMLAERTTLINKGKIVPYEDRPQRALQNYRSYLRVLDATDNGIEIPEIAKTMLPHQDFEGAKKSVRNWSIAAKKIRSDSYVTLPIYQQANFEKRKSINSI